MATWKAASVVLAVALAAAIGYAVYLRQGPLQQSVAEGQHLAGEIAGLRASSQKVETDFKAQTATQGRQIQVLQGKVTQLEASLSAAQETKASAAREHQEEVGSLQKQVVQGRKDIASLQSEQAALVQRAAVLQRENDVSGAQLAELNRQLAASTDRLAVLAREKAATQGIQAELVGSLRAQIQNKDLKINTIRDELRITMLGKVLFNPGNAVISAHGKAVLKNLAEQLKKVHGVRIVVRGHTDNQPLAEQARAAYIDNLGLSAERAAAVGRTLRAMGVDPRNLSAAGYSMYQPVASNATAEGRQQNRRVELVLTPIRAEH
ncbi:MAG: OmpA family protein [Burkholderiales bacterium]